MAQSTYLGFVATPSGKRLVMQSGTHAFTTSATECTLSIHMRRVVAAHVTTGQAQSLNKTHKIAYFPYVTATDMTSTYAGTITPYRLAIRRPTGSLTAMKFAYHLVGW
jgi:hypothetical protein